MRLLIYLLCVVIAACGGAQADPVPSPPTIERESVEITPPDWATLSTTYTGSRVSIGGYPMDGEFGENTTGIVQGMVGAVQIPASMAAPNHSAGLAGYARTASQSNMAVGVHGFGGVTADGGQSEGGHFLATNCGNQYCPVGVDASNNYVVEIDLNMMQTPKGQPTGNAFGLIFFGAGNATPKGLFQAIHIDAPGVFQTPVIPWKQGLVVADGAASVGMSVGKARIANDRESQPLEFRASTSGADRISVIQNMPNGDLTFATGSGTAVVDGWVIRIAKPQTPTSSNMPCNIGQIQWDSNYTYVCVQRNHWRRTPLTDF